METLRDLLKISFWILAFLGIVLIIEVICGPIATLDNLVRIASIKSRVPKAKAQWEAKGISSYSMEVDADIPFCSFVATLNVRDNMIASIGEKENYWISPDMCRSFADYSNLRIPQFLDRVGQEANTLDWIQTSLIAAFDSEFGYVTYYRTDCSYVTHAIGDCIDVYRFTNFQPINDSSP